MIKFYTAEICPFAHRVAIALHETLGANSPTVERVEIDLANKPEWYAKKINPAGTVPTLQLENGKFVYESDIIAEFVLEKYGNEHLLPKDPVIKADIRFFVSKFGDSLIPAFYGFLRAKEIEAQPAALEKLNKALEDLNNHLIANSPEGPYAFGKDFTMADILTIPWFMRWHAIQHFRGLPFPEHLTRLSQWIAACKERASLKATNPDNDKLIEAYKKLAA